MPTEGIVTRKYLNDIAKEVFRKGIHLCTAFVPLFLSLAYCPVLVLLALALVLYTVEEFLRLRGGDIPFVTRIIETAARKRDEGRFVLGPFTLCLGVLVSALCFSPVASSCGILSLAFGDGLASLCGKLFGRHVLPLTRGKTAEGSLACFLAIFVSTCAASGGHPQVGLVLAVVGTVVELLPIKDFDNLIIPILVSAVAQFAFGL